MSLIHVVIYAKEDKDVLLDIQGSYYYYLVMNTISLDQLLAFRLNFG